MTEHQCGSQTSLSKNWCGVAATHAGMQLLRDVWRAPQQVIWRLQPPSGPHWAALTQHSATFTVDPISSWEVQNKICPEEQKHRPENPAPPTPVKWGAAGSSSLPRLQLKAAPMTSRDSGAETILYWCSSRGGWAVWKAKDRQKLIRDLTIWKKRGISHVTYTRASKIKRVLATGTRKNRKVSES